MISSSTFKLAEEVIHNASENNVKIAVAESCTGGMLSGYLTSVPGSSLVFERGFITYSNKAKRDMLGVSNKTLKDHGAISMEAVLEMLQGLLEVAPTHYGISITGIAGPDGGTIDKPVGLVYIGYGSKEEMSYKKFTFLGDRMEVREQACKEALKILLKLVSY